ncbi:MAG: hypothetical protein Q4F79_01885 [Eubacteriales bacterium]|nr:hypothetical protein [Eubacteriales bacterium]
MIKSALEYIVGLQKPNIIEARDGWQYSDKSLERISYNPKARGIELTTLSSLIEYIKSGVDKMQGDMIVHVKTPQKVALYSSLDDERTREYVIEVNAELPTFPFGRYLGHEEFCIGLQSKFLKNNDRELLLKFAGTVEAGTIANYGDDGVTQKATVKTGVASKSDAVVPSPVSLQAYRTFVEIEQPECQYIFRMRQDRDQGIECALFEADGGAWKLQAMQSIKEYLRVNLTEMQGYIVIA